MSSASGSSSSDAKHNQQEFEQKNFYELLGVSKNATVKEITKAYRKTALRYHPDHNQSDYATAAFQHLTRVHQILTKDSLRKLYDRTGSVEDEDMQFEESYDHWRSVFPAFTMEDVEKFKTTYVESEMEKEDLLAAFQEAKGNMAVVMDSVPYCTLEDTDRFAAIIEEAGVANAEFRKSLKAVKRNRAKAEKAAQKEAKEAEELSQMLGISSGGGGDLAMIIRQRQQNRESAFNGLLDKYGGTEEAPRKKSGKRKKKPSRANDDDEPPEDAFAKNRRR